MKSIGQQAKEFRTAMGWNWVEMAAAVSRNSPVPVLRQSIKNLEDAGDRMPSYLRALAKTMGVSSDTLLDGLYSPSNAPDTGQPVAQEVQANYTDITVAQGIETIQQALLGMTPTARASAATLLSSMARDPEGQWARWFADLVDSEMSQKATETAKNDRSGKSLSVSSNDSSTMAQQDAISIGAELKSAFDAAGGDDESQSGGIQKPRSGQNT